MRRTRTTTISNLPSDLLEEIITRVPLKLMKAVRLTCKSWNNLSKSESLTKMHFEKATTTREGEVAMMIMTMPHNLYLMSVVVDHFDLSLELKGKLSLHHNLWEAFHYEGLLICILKDVPEIVVWNPYLGQTRSIQLRYSDPNLRFSYALGYEDKESRHSLKILRFYEELELQRQVFWYEIYDFDSGSWRALDVTPHWFIPRSSSSLSLKGNTYWCANKERSRDIEDHIICFDFTRERFGPLLPLPPVSNYYDGCVNLSCVKEEKLAALFQNYGPSEYEFEIWITTKVETEMVSWSMFLRMDTRPKIYISDSYFIDEEKKVFMTFDKDIGSDSIYLNTFFNIIGEGKRLKQLDMGDLGVPAEEANVCFYVPSLVQIKEPAQGKRKRQSSKEDCRFDQNKLKLDAYVESITKII